MKRIALYLILVPLFTLIGVAIGAVDGWKRGVADVRERLSQSVR